ALRVDDALRFFNQVAGGVEGHGVDVTTKTSGGNYPDGFAVKPIATGAIVTMRAHYDASDQGSGPLLRYTFEAINTDDGPCEAA
ncbi:MAG: hypothetical protein MI741_17880, partial [Rhodospirillales bacterium]|nr:hypothetical protein [Rhodospirillales bacterium]